MSLSSKPAVYRLLRHVPMPMIAIVVGLAAGLAVWAVLDQVQSRAVESIFDTELQARLDLRSRESMLNFDQYMTNYAATTRLLANHRRVAQYLEPLFWFPEETVSPVVYEGFRPFWLPDFFGRNALIAPSHVLLVDSRGHTREIYQATDMPLPPEFLDDTKQWIGENDDVHTALARFGERPYLVVSDEVEDAGGYGMGHLVVVVPVDKRVLGAAEGAVSADHSVVALVDADEQRILVSNEPQVLIPGTTLDQWSAEYDVTLQSLPAYEGSNWNVLFATFIPHSSVAKMTERVVEFERSQRIIAAAVFIFVFTLVIYLVSARLNKVLTRMSRFSQRALDIEHPGFKRGGNQLLMLEEWIQHFTNLVLRAREDMSRRHEHEMRETEALQAAIMEASLDAIVTLDQDGEIIDFNPMAEAMFGFRRDAIKGTDFALRFLDKNSHGAFMHMLQESSARENEGMQPHARGQLVARREDGNRFPIEMSFVPIDLDDERVYTLYIHDATKRKEAERQIKSLARFASESPSPILRVAGDGSIVYANAASAPLLREWRTGLMQPLPACWIEAVHQALDECETREQEDDLGSCIYSLLFVPICDLGYANIYARDITAVRRAEQESRQHQSELVHVCRLSTMGEVATGMAHELNQPLSAIVNYANGASRRLQNDVGDKEALVGAMGQISSQAQRAGEIIKRLRALVGKQAPIRSPVDLNYLVREVCGFVEFDTARLDMQVSLELAEGEIPVNVDLVQIEQVLLNLVRNALDALEEIPDGERKLLVSTDRDGGHARVHIRDNGPGIPEERMQHLFDPFYTTKDTGMGMGLPISQTIIEDHEGLIWAESHEEPRDPKDPSRGTSFHVRLPVAAADQGSPAPKEAEPLGRGGESARSLPDYPVAREVRL